MDISEISLKKFHLGAICEILFSNLIILLTSMRGFNFFQEEIAKLSHIMSDIC